MPTPDRIDLLIALSAAALVALAALAGLPEALGAHPWWARQAGMVGGAFGAACYLFLRLRRWSPARLLVAAVAAVAVAAAAAHGGRLVFAASFAENALAGRFWYLGWFAACGSGALLLAAAAARLRGR